MLDAIKLLHNMNLVTNMQPEENNLGIQGLLRLLNLYRSNQELCDDKSVTCVSTVRNTYNTYYPLLVKVVVLQIIGHKQYFFSYIIIDGLLYVQKYVHAHNSILDQCFVLKVRTSELTWLQLIRIVSEQYYLEKNLTHNCKPRPHQQYTQVYESEGCKKYMHVDSGKMYGYICSMCWGQIQNRPILTCLDSSKMRWQF